MNIILKALKKFNLFRAKDKKIKDLSCPPNVIMGRGTYYEDDCSFMARDGAKIIIGNYCSIGDRVIILNVNHNYKNISTYPFSVLRCEDKSKKSRDRTVSDVIIGNDVWIGSNAIILKGVKIGDGAVIGAGSIVTKSVPPYAIVAGNPAKVIKFRFKEDVIKALLEIKWWEWPEEFIDAHIDDFYLPVEQFIKKFSQLNVKV